MKVRKSKFVLFICSIILLSGCATGNSDSRSSVSGGSTLEPQTMLKFSDIPVPVGFKTVGDETYCFETSGVRVGLLRYQGKANVDQVVNFYKEQMPMYNWYELNIIEYGQRMLNYDRDSETCNISLLPRGNNVTITIAVGPKSREYIKKAKPIK